MIAIIDYGIGNVRSVMNAFEYIGANAILTRDPYEIANSGALVLPGVGSFGEGIHRLNKYRLFENLKVFAATGKPILGICLGFQMLMRSSAEQGQHVGLSLIERDVVRLPVNARLPHIGWSNVIAAKNGVSEPRLLVGLDNELFYFVHSYGVLKNSEPLVSGLVNYAGYEFIAMVESNNIFGTQFHPEKSGEAGLQMLKNFTNLC